MKRPTPLARAALTFAALSLTVPPVQSAPPQTETPAQVRSEIRRLYQVFDAMHDTHNAAGEIALYLPTFVGTDERGQKFTYDQLRAAVTAQYAKDRAREHGPNGHTTTSFQRTTPTSIQVSSNHAAVRWAGHVEALAQGGGSWGHVSQDSTGEDTLVWTSAGWRFQDGRVFTTHQTNSGGLTPEGALAVQKVFQAKQHFDQVIAGEQASDDQQQQIRIEQDQHDEQVWRRKHGY